MMANPGNPKYGKTLARKYTGGSPGMFRYESSDGLKILKTNHILASFFAGDSAFESSPSRDDGSETSVAASQFASAFLSQNPPDKRFPATIESDLAVNSTVVAHRQNSEERVFDRTANRGTP